MKLTRLVTLWTPFGGGPVAITEEPTTLISAVRFAYLNAGLGTQVGPFRAGRARRTEAPPHVVVIPRDEGLSPDIAPTAHGQASLIHLVFHCRGETGLKARAMAQKLDAWMLADGGRKFAWDGGESGPAFRIGGQKVIESNWDRNGRLVCLEVVAYQLTVWGKA